MTTDAQTALANMREAIQGVIEPAVLILTTNEASTILAHVEAQKAEIERLRERLRIVADELDNLLAKEQR